MPLVKENTDRYGRFQIEPNLLYRVQATQKGLILFQNFKEYHNLTSIFVHHDKTKNILEEIIRKNNTLIKF